jgi:hypothetical protein
MLNGLRGGMEILPKHEDHRCHNKHRPHYDDQPKNTPLGSRRRYSSGRSY